MVSRVATQVVTASIQSQSTEEFVGFLIPSFLARSPDPARPVLGGGEFSRFMRSMGDEGNVQAGLEFLASVQPQLDRRGVCYTSLVASGMALGVGALDMSCDFYMEALKTPLREHEDVWWAVHAGVLGLCVRVARIPPEAVKPFSSLPDAVSLNDLISYLGTYAKFTNEGMEQPILEPRRELLHVFATASHALYSAAELRPDRTGVVGRFRDQWTSEHLTQEQRSFFGRERRSRALELAGLVDSLTRGQWQFLPAVGQIEQMWAEAYESL